MCARLSSKLVGSSENGLELNHFVPWVVIGKLGHHETLRLEHERRVIGLVPGSVQSELSKG